MDNKKNGIPKLRFPGFTGAWEQRKLGEIIELYGGNAFSSKDSTTDGIPWLKISNVSTNGIDWEIKSFLPTNYWKKYPEYQLKNGDYVMALTRPVLNHALKIGRVDRPSLLNQRVAKLKFKFNREFTFQLLRRQQVVLRIENELAGTDPPNLGSRNLIQVNITLPINIHEQQKIGEYFSKFDTLIALHQRKLEHLKEQKKGLLQKMFPKNGEVVPEVRFPGFTDDWEQRKLRKTNTFFTDGNYGEAYPKSSDMTNSNDGVPFLTGGNLKDGQIDITDVNYITKKKHEELTSGHLIEDDIIIAVRGSLGALGYVNKKNIDWNINSQLAILRTNKTELIGKYLLQFLLSSRGQIELTKRQTGSALKQLPIKALKDINIPITSIREQQKIGQFFNNLDSLIALHQRKLEHLKLMKKGLLQQMFV